MKKDNRGLSLVEVVIVITILAVLGSLMTVGIGAAVSKSADECAEKIATTLNGARISTMGKQAVQVKIYQKDDSIYADEVITDSAGNVTTKTNVVGKKGVEVQFMLRGGSYQDIGNESNPLQLSFSRTSGGFHKTTVGGVTDYCTGIQVSKGTKTKTIDLAYLTGKVSIN
ncbi:MAG: type II secretion system protein [Lachnospiraceae bacterium]|nr:type II secretion system protein [Lachnospiraceae bacterium]